MNPERNGKTSQWRDVIDALVLKIEDDAEIDRRDTCELPMLRSANAPASAEQWREAVDNALALGNQEILDFVLKCCKKSDTELNFLHIGEGEPEDVATSQLWQCVAELQIEKVILRNVGCVSNGGDFSVSKTLRTLILESCTIKSKSFFEEISRFSGLKILQILSTNRRAFKPFPNFLKLLPNLEELVFHPHLLDALGQPVLAPDESGYFHPDFPKSLATHKFLKILTLVSVPREDLVLLLEAAETTARLEILTVDFNVSQGDSELNRAAEVCRAFAAAIKKNSSLRRVGLLMRCDFNASNMDFAKPIVEAVGAQKRIEGIFLDCPHYPGLLKPLVKHPTLKCLDLQNWRHVESHVISRETFDDLISVLDSVPTLEQLALPAYPGYVDNDHALQLIEAIGRAKALTNLDLRSVIMDAGAFTNLLNQATANPKIKHLAYEIMEVLGPSMELLGNNASLTTLALHPEPEMSGYFTPNADIEFRDEFARFRRYVRFITGYNSKLASPEIQELIRQAFSAFARATRIYPDLAELIRRKPELSDVAGAKTLMSMREINRSAASLPPNSPWKNKLNEIVNKIRPAIDRLQKQGIQCAGLLGDRPEDKDEMAWRDLFAAAICLPESELLHHLLKDRPPTLSTLIIGNASRLATQDWITPNPKSLRLAMESLSIQKLAFSGIRLSAAWFKELEYFSFSSHLTMLGFDCCMSSDEPFAELIRNFKSKNSLDLRFTRSIGCLPSQEIFESIGKNQAIGALTYEGGMLHPDCLRHLSANRKFQTLRLHGKILSVTCRELATLLVGSSTMTTLKLDTSVLDDQRLGILADAFKNSKVLQILELTNNYFTVEQEKKLIGALKANRTIKKIIPWSIFWDDESRKKYTALFGDRMEIPRGARGPGQPLALMNS